eukprot:6512488-Pyramimonas_sp.AAC.1
MFEINPRPHRLRVEYPAGTDSVGRHQGQQDLRLTCCFGARGPARRCAARAAAAAPCWPVGGTGWVYSRSVSQSCKQGPRGSAKQPTGTGRGQ